MARPASGYHVAVQRPGRPSLLPGWHEDLVLL